MVDVHLIQGKAMLISLATPCHRKRRQVLASSMNVPQKGFGNWYMYLTHSRASVTQTVAKWSYRTKGIEPHACIEIENYATLFFMVNMASSMVHRCVCPMMKKQMSHNMAAILQLIRSLGLQRTSFILDIHFMINLSSPVKQGICWPVSRGYIMGSSLELLMVTRFLKLTNDQVMGFD